PHQRLLARAFAHRHASQCTRPQRCHGRPIRRLSPRAAKAVSLERTCTAQDSERDVARAARLDPESLLSQADIGLWGLFLVYNPDLIGNTPVFTARQTPSSGAFATRSSLSSSWSPATLEVLLRAGLAG